MGLSRKIISLLLTLACPGLCAAQEKEGQPGPDLGGSWVLDKNKSYIDNLEWTRLSYDKDTVVIVQRGPEIKITRNIVLDGEEHRLSDAIFFADGRGEENEVLLAEGGKARKVGTAESKTQWKRGRLVVKGKSRFKLDGLSFESDFTDTWELSKDGETLTRTRKSYETEVDSGGRRSRPRLPLDLQAAGVKLVYRRSR
ncbi:MAG TPA: hypothetical protein VD861_02705 [Pyrinomonadaceae bacterium]|nr:hypothetical protein [Pyrinomonadaceae bacterium]